VSSVGAIIRTGETELFGYEPVPLTLRLQQIPQRLIPKLRGENLNNRRIVMFR